MSNQKQIIVKVQPSGKKPAQGKKAKKIRGGKKSGGGGGKGSSIQMKQSTSVARSAPVAIYAPKTTWCSSQGFMRDGKPGTRLRGCYPICHVRQNSSNSPFQSINGGSVTDIILLHPLVCFPADSLPGVQSGSFTRFRFTQFNLSYETRVATGISGSFLSGYYPDGAAVSGDFSGNPAYIYAMTGALSQVVWASGPMVDFTPNLPVVDDYYIDLDTTGTITDAGLRQTYQGCLAGTWDTTPSNSYYGYIFADFTLELYEPRPDLDLTLMRSIKMKRDGLDRKTMLLSQPHMQIYIAHELERAKLRQMGLEVKNKRRIDGKDEKAEPPPVQTVFVSNPSSDPVQINIAGIYPDGGEYADVIPCGVTNEGGALDVSIIYPDPVPVVIVAGPEAQPAEPRPAPFQPVRSRPEGKSEAKRSVSLVKLPLAKEGGK